MSQVFTQLGLKIWKTNVKTQKIDGTTLETYGMIVFTFSVSDKDGRERFFVESFLLVEVKPDIVLEIPFLTINNADVDFQARDLQWRSYTTGDVFPITRQVELIEKKKFALAALDLEHEVFIVYIAALSIDSDDEVHPLKKAQIAHLKTNEAFAKVSSEFADFENIFSPKLAVKLPEYMEINNHVMALLDDWQCLYGPIYSLGPMKLEILKAYIKNNLVNNFINPSKSLIRAPILFDMKLDGSLRLCIDYQDLNNLIIKNQYLLSLVKESLNRLGRAQYFTQLNLTNTYHRMRIRESNK